MPIQVQKVLITDKHIEYLKSRGLVAQYKKAKAYIIAGRYRNADLKLREPKEKGIWYFRINRQYRAKATYRDGALRIFEIDDHSR